MSRYFLLLAVVIFSGCAIVPENIDVPDGTPLVSYSKAVTSGATVQGQKARWGGLIVGVENKPNKTYIELAHFPLNHYGKPNTGGETSGRFKVQIDGFVDPIVFEEGRAATFLGTVTLPTSGLVGEQPYIYPTIIADDYHMWRKRDVYEVDTMFFNYHTGWYSPFYGPGHFFGPWGSPFYRPWGSPFFHPGFNRTRVIRYQNAPSRSTMPKGKQTNNQGRKKSTAHPIRLDKQK